MLQYKVEIKYLKGTPIVLAQFKEEADARAYIAAKMENDISMRQSVTYILLELGEELETFDTSGKATVTTSGDSSGVSGGKSSSQNFRPNPLQTTLRPSGMPPSSFKNEDDKDKK
jgi:hypothetical protein